MATATLSTTEGNSNWLITEIPWHIRKIRVTSGTTAAAIEHLGPEAPPDIVWGTQISGSTPDGGFSVTAMTSTTITIDFADDGNDDWYIYCIWFNQTAGGIS